MAASLSLGIQACVIGLDYSGQKSDVKLVCRELEALGHQARSVFRKPLTRTMRVAAKLGLHSLLASRADLNVFIQQPERYWIPLARRNVVIPNQDWMTDHGAALLHRMDEVWCKTRYAMDIFGKRGLPCRYIGFSSPVPEEQLDLSARDWHSFLHVAGSSLAKGTQQLLEIWALHPEWPRLTVLAQHPSLHALCTGAANVVLHAERIGPEQLRRLRMCCGVAIQPSETEGYGHVVSEAMAAHQVVVTCDAPPMNELVSAGEGFLLKARRHSTQYWSDLFRFEAADLQKTVRLVLSTPPSELAALGHAARAVFESREEQFRLNLKMAMQAMSA